MADNSPFMTPGSAAADELQNILANRRAEQHQKLVDSLNLVNTQSEVENRAQNTQALSDARKAQSDELQAKQASRVQMQKGLAAFDPTQLDPQDQQMFRLAQSTGDMDLLKALVTGSLAREKGPQGGNVLTVDDKGNVVDSGVYAGPGQVVRDVPRLPQAQRHVYTLGEMDDPNNPGKKIPAWLDPENPTADPIPTKGGAHKVVNPPKQTASRVTPAEVNSLRSARVALQKAGEGWSWSSTNPAKQVAEENVNSAVGTILGKLPTPQLRKDVQKVIGSAVAKDRNVAEIVQQLKDWRASQNMPLTPDEESAAQEIIPIVLGRF